MYSFSRRTAHELARKLVDFGLIPYTLTDRDEKGVIEDIQEILECLSEEHSKIDSDRGDWNRYLFSWIFTKISLDGYAGWDKKEDGSPYFVMMEHTRGKSDEEFPGRMMQVEFDDISTGLFYYRDWTSDGIPFVREGDVYWSGWWFQFKEDAFCFQQMYGGVGDWQKEYPEWQKRCQAKRKGIGEELDD